MNNETIFYIAGIVDFIKEDYHIRVTPCLSV